MYLKESALTYSISGQHEQMHSHAINNPLVQRNGEELLLSQFVEINSPTTEVINASTVMDIKALNGKRIHSIVNLKRINDITDVNAFFTIVNKKLPYNGMFIGCVETLEQRKVRILNKCSRVISYPYYIFDFINKRIFPKWKFTRKIADLITYRKNHAMSITETLGRLRICGFKIVEYEEVGKLTYFVVRKIARPVISADPKYGIIIRLRRVGKGGKLFNVYKLRTMHPYAEFLQNYLYSVNHLENGDKICNDFRITSWGRILRKLWLDELPMWINWFKGDVKLIGVRPLSNQKLSLYPPEFKKRRFNYTPGLIPPFYVDLPESLEELIDSEKKYFDSYDKNPILTDLRYFFLAMYNIIIKRARSS